MVVVKKPQPQQQQKSLFFGSEERGRMKRFIEPEEDEDKGEDRKPKPRLSVPVTRRNTANKLPVRVWEASRELLNAYKEKKINLGHETMADLKRFTSTTTGFVDETTAIDPLVVVYGYAQTRDYKIHLSEWCPVSTWLLAVVTRASYTIARLEPEVFTMSFEPSRSESGEPQIKPYRPNPTKRVCSETYNIEECVKDALGDPKDAKVIMEQVNGYMISLGPLSSREVCDENFLETHLERFKDIVAGSFKPVKVDKLGSDDE